MLSFEEQKALIEEDISAISSVVDHKLDEDALEMLYSVALNLWKAANYNRSIQVYGFLHLYEPRNPKYLEAMARCYYDMGEYRHALSMYSYAGMCGGDKPLAAFRAAQCHLMLGDVSHAMTMLAIVLRVEEENPASVSDDVLEKVHALLVLISENLEDKKDAPHDESHQDHSSEVVMEEEEKEKKNDQE